tara:strand:- start:12477 stop:12794 length:318 start_codon:yes stop_codon:yes gene_type:complete
MSIKKVDVLNYNEKKAKCDNRYPGTYLHGVLEQEIGFDIFSFDRKIHFELGATKVIITSTGRRATFFLWEVEDLRSREYLGYLVYDNDPDYEFCRKKFENKAQCI